MVIWRADIKMGVDHMFDCFEFETLGNHREYGEIDGAPMKLCKAKVPYQLSEKKREIRRVL